MIIKFVFSKTVIMISKRNSRDTGKVRLPEEELPVDAAVLVLFSAARQEYEACIKTLQKI